LAISSLGHDEKSEAGREHKKTDDPYFHLHESGGAAKDSKLRVTWKTKTGEAPLARKIKVIDLGKARKNRGKNQGFKMARKWSQRGKNIRSKASKEKVSGLSLSAKLVVHRGKGRTTSYWGFTKKRGGGQRNQRVRATKKREGRCENPQQE